MRPKATVAAIGIAGLLLVGTGCGDDNSAGTGAKVTVRMYEYAFDLNPVSVRAGKVRVEAKNVGSATHEVVVVTTDPKQLPVLADGSVDDDRIDEEDAWLGETGEVQRGETKTTTLDLTPGVYTLFCNVVDDQSDGTSVSHFAKGMVTTLRVS